MADNLASFQVFCQGGLNTSRDVLSQGQTQPGSAITLLNYEPAVTGGYRKISGFSNDFGSVTGTGSVLGVCVANGINQGILACRTPSSGNNYLHHWSFYYTFTVASDANLTVGQTISERETAGDSSTATTVTGTLISKSSNTIVVDFGKVPGTSIFTNGNAISDDSFSTSTTLTSVPAKVGWAAVTTSGSPTMTGVSKVRFSRYNFGSPKVLLTDGVNPAATYDGSTYTQITHANAPDDPKFSAIFQNHLFLAGDPNEETNLYFSAPYAETDFSTANGSGVINVGFPVVAIKTFRDALYIFGSNNIRKLIGNNISNFVLETVTDDLGCLATDSVIEIGGDLLFLSQDGLRPISGTDKIGDVNLETVSKDVQSIFTDIVFNIDLEGLNAVVIRQKTQFRYFFAASDSQGIIGGFRQTPNGLQFEYSQMLGIRATCSDSGYIGQDEFVLHGDSSGKVHRQEQGNDFDGENILSIFQTPFYYMQDPEQRKIFYTVATYLRSEGDNEIAMSAVYDYEDVATLNPTNFTLSTAGAAAYYNEAIYNSTAIFDGNPSPVQRTNISGSGKSASFRYVTNDSDASHSIQGLVITFGVGDRL
jgi:hypothetical protein